MPDLDEIVVISSRIEHQRDFAFDKNRGEIANLIRHEFTEGGKFYELATLTDVFLDEEDDIGFRTDKGNWYVTPTNVSIVGWPVKLDDIITGKCSKDLSKLMEAFFDKRKNFKATVFSIRLFVLSNSESNPSVLTWINFATPLVNLLGDQGSQNSTIFRSLTTFGTGVFENTFELESQQKEVQLRYTREAPTQSFDSYARFLSEANLQSMAENLRAILRKSPAAAQ